MGEGRRWGGGGGGGIARQPVQSSGKGRLNQREMMCTCMIDVTPSDGSEPKEKHETRSLLCPGDSLSMMLSCFIHFAGLYFRSC